MKNTTTNLILKRIKEIEEINDNKKIAINLIYIKELLNYQIERNKLLGKQRGILRKHGF